MVFWRTAAYRVRRSFGTSVDAAGRRQTFSISTAGVSAGSAVRTVPAAARAWLSWPARNPAAARSRSAIPRFAPMAASPTGSTTSGLAVGKRWMTRRWRRGSARRSELTARLPADRWRSARCIPATGDAACLAPSAGMPVTSGSRSSDPVGGDGRASACGCRASGRVEPARVCTWLRSSRDIRANARQFPCPIGQRRSVARLERVDDPVVAGLSLRLACGPNGTPAGVRDPAGSCQSRARRD